jgi:hypothetical protein
MIVHADGGYEIGSWLTAETYPNAFYIEDESELAAKVIALYPYFTLNIVDGVFADVIPRDKTQEEIDQENAPPPKTADQLRIEQLEDENAMMALEVATANIRLDQSEQAQADLMLTLVLEGVL